MSRDLCGGNHGSTSGLSEEGEERAIAPHGQSAMYLRPLGSLARSRWAVNASGTRLTGLSPPVDL
jgi:hypothetical protein